MRSVFICLVVSVPIALSLACGGSDTYVQPTQPAQPAVTVVQQPTTPAPAPPATTKVEVETKD